MFYHIMSYTWNINYFTLKSNIFHAEWKAHFVIFIRKLSKYNPTNKKNTLTKVK